MRAVSLIIPVVDVVEVPGVVLREVVCASTAQVVIITDAVRTTRGKLKTSFFIIYDFVLEVLEKRFNPYIGKKIIPHLQLTAVFRNYFHYT
jgi:hypothetical protein